ncbi:poly(beta-D-mannuronate) O-acetylase [Aquipluma nitroreducens]|uniref:Poly(Beta-D-mannuronate) O-acetylase n=1 Tax=Aquipluma nitroreducens TaxID=2010828 RepID=A0A5K7SG26_9BACT|nr:MBOAT family O-acyltransferase [Aquipluma nitroreducens]BBE20560.1 poly(beta-D-mannuronate) O-acetylase [Aquipluma nitroreducens]
MTFISFHYFFLLSISLIVYYAINSKYKYWVIFIASIFFIYSISVNVLLFSFTFTALNYFGGLNLYKCLKNTKLRKITFWSLIGLDIGILIFFKYINFIFESINSFFQIAQIPVEIGLLKLILPIGISYYTFQSIGYLIRINRGFEMPERNFIRFSSFLLFFPKFLSGPVERSDHFFPQISNLKNFNQTLFSSGLRLILFGAFKKMVIADNLHEPLEMVYNNVYQYSGTPLISVLFIQLIYVYYNFSGYTDIALGSAKLFGIEIIDNFNRPFLSKSITEFWKRWHISLSSWCNEFIYFPFIIKYRKLGNIASVLGIFVTFLIIGIWHGANWTFVILGLLQALAIIYEFYTKRYRLKLASGFPLWFSNTISRILVYIFMSFSIVFFFSNSLVDAVYFITNLFKNIDIRFSGFHLLTDSFKFKMALCYFIILLCYEILIEKGYDLQSLFFNQPRWVRWSLYYLVIILIYFQNSEISTFVYMKF